MESQPFWVHSREVNLIVWVFSIALDLALGLGWASASETPSLAQVCIEQLSQIAPDLSSEQREKICAKSQRLESCVSGEGRQIPHYDWASRGPGGKRILVLGMTHGDESESGRLVAHWMARMLGFEPRNQWRVIPLLNPDGWKKKVRTNGAGVDLNRNFPTAGWEQQAPAYWAKTGKDPRRSPGPKPGSEPEVACLLKHIADYQPEFVVSVHTPYGLLDFDGPAQFSIRGGPLPWKPLGNFPGSLGRYLWKDHQVPVLTVELGPKPLGAQLEKWMTFQDQLSGFAIKTAKSAPVEKSGN